MNGYIWLSVMFALMATVEAVLIVATASDNRALSRQLARTQYAASHPHHRATATPYEDARAMDTREWTP